MLNVYGKRRKQGRELDWGVFWVLEVLALALPLFVAVLSLQRAGVISHVKLAIVLSIQGCLTVLNCIWVLSRGSQSMAKPPVASSNKACRVGLDTRKAKPALLPSIRSVSRFINDLRRDER